MRNRLALVVLAMSSLCVAQATAPPDLTATRTYHSDAPSFDFTYPASFADSRTTVDSSPDANCVTVPFQLTEMSTGFHLISLKQFDSACLKKKDAPSMGLATAATGFLTDSLSRLGKPVLNSNANYYLAGHNASTVSGMVKLAQGDGSQTIFGAVSCVSADQGVLCFQFLANDCPGLTALSVNRVKFLGSVASPVIPPGIGTACKK